MAAIDFKDAIARISFNAGMTEEGKLIKKTKTYRNIVKDANADALYQGLAALGNLSVYPVIEVEKVDTSVISE